MKLLIRVLKHRHPRNVLVILVQSHSITGLLRFDDTLLSANQRDRGLALGKDPATHHPGDIVESLLQSLRLIDAQPMAIKDAPAIVRDEACPFFHPRTQSRQGARYTALSHGQDLDRQRKIAQHLDALTLIYYAQKLPGHRGDNFLAGQGPAPTLDHLAVRIDFICAVDIPIQSIDLIKIKNPDAVVLQALGRAL